MTNKPKANVTLGRTLGPLVLAIACFTGGSQLASGADLRAGYHAPEVARVARKARATKVVMYKPSRQICVSEYGPDAPRYGYGCLDHWVKIRDRREVVQDNGVGYQTTVVRVMRRYPPENYAQTTYLLRDHQHRFFAYDYSYEPGSLLGCPGCK